MRKSKYVMIMVLYSLTSCTTIKTTYSEYISPQIGNVASSISNATDNIREKNYEKSKDQEHWNIEPLDTAVDEDYLSLIEKNIILEVNKVRSEPKKYAELYIEPMLKRFTGKQYRISSNYYLITNEGKSAVQECIEILKKTNPLTILYPNRDLYNLALDHVNKQGPAGETGHTGPSGETFGKRIERIIASPNYTGENIAYGSNSARDIVIQLLIDDGVPSRGHRGNILNEKYNSIGVSYGSHKEYKNMCVMDLGRY